MWNVINLHTNLFRRLNMPKMTKVRYWLPSLGGSGVILFQIAAVEKFSEKQKQPLWDYQEDGSSSSPGTSLDQSMMAFILSKVTRIRWSRTLLKTNIIPGQHQEFCCYFKSTNENFKNFQNIFGRLLLGLTIIRGVFRT